MTTAAATSVPLPPFAKKAKYVLDELLHPLIHPEMACRMTYIDRYIDRIELNRDFQAVHQIKIELDQNEKKWHRPITS